MSARCVGARCGNTTRSANAKPPPARALELKGDTDRQRRSAPAEGSGRAGRAPGRDPRLPPPCSSDSNTVTVTKCPGYDRSRLELAHDRFGRLEEPGDRSLVILGLSRPGQVAFHVGDGTGQHPESILKTLEAGPGDDDLALVQTAFAGSPAGLVVTLAAALAAVLPGPARSVPITQGPLAPPAPALPGPACSWPSALDFRHVTKRNPPPLRIGGPR